MRPLKIKKEALAERDKTFEQLLTIAKTKAFDNDSQKLLDEIRSGNREAIEKLVNSFEIIILKVASQIETEMPVEEMIAIGKKSLMKLAEMEVGSTHRERFFRFAVWQVKQAILTRIK